MDQKSQLEKNSELLPQSECDDLARIMSIKLANGLAGKYFVIQCFQQEDGFYVKVILRNQKETFYYPVEGRYHRSGSLTGRAAIELMLDYIDLYFADYVQDSSVLLPLDWKDYHFNEQCFQLRGQISNSYVERMADELLKNNKQQLSVVKD